MAVGLVSIDPGTSNSPMIPLLARTKPCATEVPGMGPKSRNHPRGVDACGHGFSRAWRIERGEGSVGVAQETVQPITRSRNRSRRVDACGGREFAPTRCI